jgi:hypothetical protein
MFRDCKLLFENKIGKKNSASPSAKIGIDFEWQGYADKHYRVDFFDSDEKIDNKECASQARIGLKDRS